MPSPWTPACLRVPFTRKHGAGAYARQSAPDDELDRCHSADDNCNDYDGHRGTAFVELTKKERATLGLILSGGIDKGSRPKIANLRPGSLAYRSDALCVGDLIVSVNGIRTGKLKHEEIVNLLKNAGEKVQLEVEYDLPYMAMDSSPCICSKVIQVRLEKENGSFGFVLRGGANVGCPLTVTYVRPGGPADRDGTIKAGDRILAVDNYNVSNIHQSDANSLLRQIEQEALFTVEYDVSLMEAVRNAAGPLLVEIERSNGGNHQLGVALSSSPKDLSSILIQSIKQASLAERCGALHVGDRVLSIDGISLDSTSTAAEASQLLRNSCGERIRLEILPLSQMMLGKRVPDVNVRKGKCSLASSSLASFATLGSNYRHNNQAAAASAAPSPSLAAARNQHTCRLQRGIEASPSSSSLPSCLSSWSGSQSAASPLCSQVCRMESIKVLLLADARGFGFSVCAGTSSAVHGPPIVGSLDPGGPAERCSVIQVGDRILAVNEISTEGMALDEVTQMISGSKPKVLLSMEFDIAESVVPSSGVFDVKLPRKGWGGLGITITSAKDQRSGRPPVITEVKRGSSAHRSGTIQVGDQLLAIGSTRTEQDDGLDEAIRVLQQHNCGQEEIVRLRIRKDDTTDEHHHATLRLHHQGTPATLATTTEEDEDDPEMPSARGWFIYSVELQRRGTGPLGLTLAGSDRPYRPVLISALAEGGPAGRTGALRVGDRLLAVDGHPVRGKTLGQVIQHLQTTVDAVVVKLARKAESDAVVTVECSDREASSPKCAGTPLPSIDSAVESWDSGDARNSSASYGAKRRSAPSRGSPTLSLDGDEEEDGRDDADQMEEDEGEEKGGGSGGGGGHRGRDFGRELSEEPEENWPHSPSHSSRGSHSGDKEDRDRDWIKVLSEFGAKETSILPMATTSGVGALPLRRRMSDEHLPSSRALSRRPCDEPDSMPSLRQHQQQQQHCSTLPHGCGRGRPRGSAGAAGAASTSNGHSSGQPPSDEEEDSSPYPIEVHRVTLFKDTVYEDFGFSVSDGLYERGVYVNRIRPGGPADIGGILRPFDRILQVNDTKTHDFDCCLTVPLIAAAGDRIHLMLVRNPQTGPRALQHEGHVPLPLTISTATTTLPWMEEEENNESAHMHCGTNTVIKSL